MPAFAALRVPAYRRLLVYSGCFTASYILVFLALQFLKPLP